MAKKKKFKISPYLIIFIVAAIAMTWAFVSITAQVIYNNQLKEKCLAIQNSPELQYSCKCFPTIKKANMSDYVENRTETFCTCNCDIGDNKTWSVEIRIAK